MEIKNTTKFPTERVRELIAFCKPRNVSGFDVNVRNCASGFHGSAFVEGSYKHPKMRVKNGRRKTTFPPFIEINIKRGHRQHESYTFPKHGAYLRFTLWNLDEVVLYLLAHEMRHLWQKKIPKGRRVWGSRGQYSERDADAYAIRIIRAWRRVSNQTRNFTLPPACNAAQ
jgi:hypothetical protein